MEQLKLKGETGKVGALTKLIEEKNGEIRTSQTQLESNRAKIKLQQPRITEYAKIANPTNLTQKELKAEISGASLCSMKFQYPKFADGSGSWTLTSGIIDTSLSAGKSL